MAISSYPIWSTVAQRPATADQYEKHLVRATNIRIRNTPQERPRCAVAGRTTKGAVSMTGAEFIAAVLRREGVEKVFGQCGHTNYALIDALQQAGIEFVSFRHEQMAAHAADAYFRTSHKLAVVLVHLSPGLTNALTGVVTASADHTPMLVIAGNTPASHHPRDAHQQIRFHSDASQGDIYRPVCKRVWRVDDPEHLPEVMARALNIAQSGRPGAVLVDVPMDVFSRSVSAPPPETMKRRPQHGRPPADAAAVEEAAALLARAER